MKKFWAMLLSLCMIGSLVACGGDSAESSGGESGGGENEILIGNLLPLSGSSASLGLIGQQARDMAVEEINAAGGIKSMGGAKLKMIYADSKGDSAEGVTQIEKLIHDRTFLSPDKPNVFLIEAVIDEEGRVRKIVELNGALKQYAQIFIDKIYDLSWKGWQPATRNGVPYRTLALIYFELPPR